MTKRAKKARINQIRDEFLARLKEHYPQAELVEVEERPAGTTVFRVHVPGAELLDVIDVNVERIAELAGTEDLDVMVLPVSYPRSDQAA